MIAAPSQATDDWNEAFILHGAHGCIHLQEQKRGNFDKQHSTKYDIVDVVEKFIHEMLVMLQEKTFFYRKVTVTITVLRDK